MDSVIQDFLDFPWAKWFAWQLLLALALQMSGCIALGLGYVDDQRNAVYITKFEIQLSGPKLHGWMQRINADIIRDFVDLVRARFLLCLFLAWLFINSCILYWHHA